MTISERGIEVPDGPTLTIDSGRATRLRVIAISMAESMRLRLVHDTTTLSWRPVAKDGADLPPGQARARAEDVVFGEGETMDLELPANLPNGTEFELRFPGNPNRPRYRLPIRVR